MKCEKCGCENPEVVEFCRNCNARNPSMSLNSRGREQDDSNGHGTRPQEHTYRSKKAILSVVVVFVLAIASASAYLAVMDDLSEGSLAFHEPITIMTDSHFTPANGVTSGTGAEHDPFVIEGWTIELSNSGGWGYGINIGWTTAHFIIKNVTIIKAQMNITQLDSSTGIIVWGPSNGTIIGCNISNMGKGIEIKEAHNITITGNSINGCYMGISGEWRYERGGSRDIRVEDNYFTGNWRACYVEESCSFHILRNEFSGNDRCVVLHKTNDTFIQNNTVFRDNADAVLVSYCRNINLSHNNAAVSGTCINVVSSNQTSIRENTICGGHICLRMIDTDNVTVVKNHFCAFDYSSASNTAIWVESSEYITITENDFEYYHIGIISICCSWPSVHSNTYDEVEIETISAD